MYERMGSASVHSISCIGLKHPVYEDADIGRVFFGLLTGNGNIGVQPTILDVIGINRGSKFQAGEVKRL